MLCTPSTIGKGHQTFDNSLLFWELTFGHKAKLLFRFWAQGLVKILKLAAEVWLRLQSRILVKILKLGLVKRPEVNGDLELFPKIHPFYYRHLSLKLVGSICPVCGSLMKCSIQVSLGVSLVIASLCTEHYVPGPVPRPVSSWKGESRRSIWCWNILSTQYVWPGSK